ncbi:MAG: S8 family serine peptidase [Roseibium sp.]|uniref:S8 family serine peptidase n=1 Tax=Roseibium sp. TaxID=1936156 RepID=UPI001B1BACD2|nr:S8 family serine peptidase [Roseibium sp.]MBO6894936.1 S8 family serine peptidase [Roseibium sp.]MBO6930826.1 S8 family serine peptidase [Roseibium sp.]
MRSLFCLAISVLLTAVPLPAAAQQDLDAADWLRLAAKAMCDRNDLTGIEAQLEIPGSWLLEESRFPPEGAARRIMVRLVLPGAHELVLERRQVNGRLRQFRLSFFEQTGSTLEPSLQAMLDGSCQFQSARKIRSEGEAWRYLDQLEGDLETLRWTETLQAPWPSGTDPGGVSVGLVDSGLAYDLPLFRDQLARDETGNPLGHDYWDMDPWPYDGDTSRGPFFPIRHGTAVASVLMREAPAVALVPYRYPRPDLNRMADLVERAAQDGVRILAMPLGSRNAADWAAFVKVLEHHDILAIVSAGNDGHDIDRTPVYPAAFDLENILTVTSSDAFGKLAPGSNWGRESVDIMLPAENVKVTDFRGAAGVASGSSYAVPLLAALAARILEKDPDLTALELKSQILKRASQSPFERNGVVANGWIPDPLAD